VGDSVTDTLVSESADGTDGNGNSFVTSISGDGNFVAFISHATNLVSNDTNGAGDLFVKNLQTGEIIRVVSAGTPFDPTTQDGELSFDGTRIAFSTKESFIAAGGPGIDDLDGQWDVYVATLDWNDPPIAVSDSYTTNEDTALNIVAPGVLANDTDADSDDLTAVLVSGPSNGTLVLNADGSFSYTPAANYNGPDSFTYTAYDGTLNSATTTVSIGVTAINDPPTGAADSASVLEDASVSIAVLANDSDVDGDTLTLTSLSGTKSTLGASIEIVNGEVRYTADADIFDVATFTGATDTFTYVASDPDGLTTGPVTVEVTVSPDLSDNQTLFGTVRPDAFTDQPGWDTIYFASNADDVVSGLDGSDVLHGENGNDQLSGGAGIDFLYGERGDDILDGGDGNDELDGGPGDDQLTGGNGSDTFIITKEAGSVDSGDDTILDFGVGVDHLQLNGLTVNSLTSADVDRTGELDAVLSFNEGGSVTLLGVGVISDWHALL
jgi:VCBS repeat-containing protein